MSIQILHINSVFVLRDKCFLNKKANVSFSGSRFHISFLLFVNICTCTYLPKQHAFVWKKKTKEFFYARLTSTLPLLEGHDWKLKKKSSGFCITNDMKTHGCWKKNWQSLLIFSALLRYNVHLHQIFLVKKECYSKNCFFSLLISTCKNLITTFLN